MSMCKIKIPSPVWRRNQHLNARVPGCRLYRGTVILVVALAHMLDGVVCLSFAKLIQNILLLRYGLSMHASDRFMLEKFLSAASETASPSANPPAAEILGPGRQGRGDDGSRTTSPRNRARPEAAAPATSAAGQENNNPKNSRPVSCAGVYSISAAPFS